MVLRLNKDKFFKVISIANTERIDLSDSNYFLTVNDSYKEGDVALTAGVVRKLLVLPNNSPERYIVIKISTLKNINSFLQKVLNSKEQPIVSKKTSNNGSSTYLDLSFVKPNF